MALINKLSAIGNAIREKTGKENLLTLDQMPEEIRGISGGGGGEVEPIVLNGDCSYACAGILSGEFIKLYGNKISTNNIYNMIGMFKNNKTVVNIPFIINTSDSWNSCEDMFEYATCLKKAPKIKGTPHSLQTGNYSNSIKMNRMFYNCYSLQEFPVNFFKDMCGEEYWASTEPYTSGRSYLFYNCVSLRKSPKGLEYLLNSASSSSHLYNNLFNNCYILEEIELPIKDIYLPGNLLQDVCSNCSRLTHFKFQTNEDGSPKVITTWTTAQTLNLTLAGRAGYDYYITDYTKYHGIGNEKKVYDNASYQALKNDPDWWANDLYYARYNHDSAVETINTLPDVSATGVAHTVIFTGDCGLYTDGGAIKNLTEAEIAVATDKGWTITLQ